VAKETFELVLRAFERAFKNFTSDGIGCTKIRNRTVPALVGVMTEILSEILDQE